MLDVRFPESGRCLIKIIGVGGAGGNAVGRMYSKSNSNIFYAVCNTDFQDLDRSDVPCKIQLGEQTCKGLGCGANTKKGRAAAEESRETIGSLFDDDSMVFVIAGMGGGTGTGAAPVVAKLAKDKGRLTIGVLTLPFRWEQIDRINKAKDGIRDMLAAADAIVVFNNQQIAKTYTNLPMSAAFREADNIVAAATLGIADIVAKPDVINLDLADLTSVLKNSGVAIMNTGESEGQNRVIEALTNAVEHPLLKGRNLSKAKQILIHISSPENNEITMGEVNGVNDFVKKFQKKGNTGISEIFWGHSVRNTDDCKCHVTLIATGFSLDDVCDWHLYSEQSENQSTEPDKAVGEVIDLDEWNEEEMDTPAYKRK